MLTTRESTSESPSSTSVIELTCPDVRSQLNDYLDGSLDPAMRDRIERHLAQCSHCRNFANSLARTIQGLQGMPPLRMPTDARERLRGRIRDRQPED